MSFRDTQAYNIMNAKDATGIGSDIFVKDYVIATLSLFTASSASLTLKVQISNQETMPDFSAAASKTNQWTYVKIVDLDDQSPVLGSTGIVLTGTDVTKQYEVNVNGAVWLNSVITSYVAGSVHLDVDLYNNQ